jgi:hypothetical protein
MAQSVQSFENHAKVVPAYHYLTFALIGFPLLWRVYALYQSPTVDNGMALAFAVGVLMTLLWARVFALRVQDRVIRLEERLRVSQLAPDLGARFEDFTIDQLCALRFASDAEVPALARRVLDEKLTDRKAIKRLVQDWRADDLRA